MRVFLATTEEGGTGVNLYSPRLGRGTVGRSGFVRALQGGYPLVTAPGHGAFLATFLPVGSGSNRNHKLTFFPLTGGEDEMHKSPMLKSRGENYSIAWPSATVNRSKQDSAARS